MNSVEMFTCGEKVERCGKFGLLVISKEADLQIGHRCQTVKHHHD